MATLSAPCATPSTRWVGSAERRARALRTCLSEYTVGAERSASELDRSDRSHLAVMHERETLRLVALLTTHLSEVVPVPSRLATPELVGLTRREIEVLDAIADGLSTIEIAAHLHISVNTARNHVQRIIEKFGVHSRLQAVNVAAQHGLLLPLAG